MQRGNRQQTHATIELPMETNIQPMIKEEMRIESSQNGINVFEVRYDAPYHSYKTVVIKAESVYCLHTQSSEQNVVIKVEPGIDLTRQLNDEATFQHGTRNIQPQRGDVNSCIQSQGEDVTSYILSQRGGVTSYIQSQEDVTSNKNRNHANKHKLTNIDSVNQTEKVIHEAPVNELPYQAGKENRELKVVKRKRKCKKRLRNTKNNRPNAKEESSSKPSCKNRNKVTKHKLTKSDSSDQSKMKIMKVAPVTSVNELPSQSNEGNKVLKVTSGKRKGKKRLRNVINIQPQTKEESCSQQSCKNSNKVIKHNLAENDSSDHSKEKDIKMTPVDYLPYQHGEKNNMFKVANAKRKHKGKTSPRNTTNTKPENKEESCSSSSFKKSENEIKHKLAKNDSSEQSKVKVSKVAPVDDLPSQSNDENEILKVTKRKRKGKKRLLNTINIQPQTKEESCSQQSCKKSNKVIKHNLAENDLPDHSKEKEVVKIAVISELSYKSNFENETLKVVKRHYNNSRKNKEGQKAINKAIKELEGSRYVGLLCDFCSFKTSQSDAIDHETMSTNMKNHFTEEQHNSASLVYINTSEGSIERPVSIIHDNFLKTDNRNHVAYFHRVVPICPVEKCSFVCATVRACAIHYEACHDKSAKDTYALGKVVYRKTVCLPIKNRCKNCGYKRQYFNDHLNNNPEHLQLIRTTDSQHALYFCTYCKCVSATISDCRSHMKYYHRKRNGCKGFAMNVVYIQKPSENLQLLPRVQKPESENLKIDMNAQRMNVHFMYRINEKVPGWREGSSFKRKVDIIKSVK